MDHTETLSEELGLERRGESGVAGSDPRGGAADVGNDHVGLVDKCDPLERVDSEEVPAGNGERDKVVRVEDRRVELEGEEVAVFDGVDCSLDGCAVRERVDLICRSGDDRESGHDGAVGTLWGTRGRGELSAC